MFFLVSFLFLFCFLQRKCSETAVGLEELRNGSINETSVFIEAVFKPRSSFSYILFLCIVGSLSYRYCL